MKSTKTKRVKNDKNDTNRKNISDSKNSQRLQGKKEKVSCDVIVSKKRLHLKTFYIFHQKSQRIIGNVIFLDKIN